MKLQPHILFLAILLVFSVRMKAQLITNNNVSITIKPSTQITVQGSVQNQNGTTIDNSGTIDLSGNWINNTINNNFGTSAGTVILNGANQTIGGSNPTLFNNLTLLGTGIKTLQINTTAGGSASTGIVSVGNRVLDLNSKTFTLFNPLTTALTYTAGVGGGYILSEKNDNSSKFTWQIGSNITNHKIPFGNAAGMQIPVEINTTAGNIGDVTVSTYPTAVTNLPLPATPIPVTHVKNLVGANNSANTVDRFWEIDKSGPSGTATLVLTHDPLEAAANGTVSIRAQRWNQGFDGWEFPTIGQSNPFSNQVIVPNVTLFNSVFALALQANPLPVELLSFTAKLNSDYQTNLNWSTASEQNSDYFVIEKSSDGEHFFDLKKIKAAGNSTTVLNYTEVDETPFKGFTYYRLRELDFNTEQSYSQIQSVYLNTTKQSAFLYPNPANDYFDLKIVGANYTDYQIIDAQGKILIANKLNSTSETYTQRIYCATLASAVYTLLLIGNNSVENRRFVIYARN